MSNQWKYLLGLLLLFLLACNRAGEHEALFKQVENIVNERPDSAMALLERIEQPETLPDAEWHWGALIWTQAKDKLFIRHTSDSLINGVVAYYDTHGDNHQKALAYYYKGRVNSDLGQLERAIDAFLQASDYSAKTDDHDLTFRILTQMGTLYARQGLDHQAFDIYREGLDIAIKANDSVNIAYGYAYLGRIEGLKQDWEQASAFYQKGLRIAEQIKDNQSIDLCVQELLGIYTRDNEIDQAIKLVKRLKVFNLSSENPNKGSLHFVIGNFYRKQNLIDSAYVHLNSAIEFGNIYTKRSAYHALYYLSSQKGDTEKAILFNEKYKACLREIEEMGSSSEIQQAKDLFEFGKRIQEEKKNKIERGVSLFLFLSFLFFLIWKWNIRKELEKDEILQEKAKIEIRDQQRREKLNELQNENESLKVSLDASKKETRRWVTKCKAKENEAQRNREAYGEKITDQLLKLPLNVAQLIDELKLNPRTLTDREIQMIRSYVQCFHLNYWSYLQKNANLQDDDLLICCLIRLGFTDMKKMLPLFPNTKNDNSGNTYNNEKYTKAAFDKRIYRIRRERLGKILNSNEELVLFLQGL